MLFNEPKLLKCSKCQRERYNTLRVSVLFNEPKLLKSQTTRTRPASGFAVSVLFNEPKLLKWGSARCSATRGYVSVLFNEPKLLKSIAAGVVLSIYHRFSALQRAEIAEIPKRRIAYTRNTGFSALQRAEIAEILDKRALVPPVGQFQCSSTSRNC